MEEIKEEVVDRIFTATSELLKLFLKHAGMRYSASAISKIESDILMIVRRTHKP
jgi:hypothetical protein